MVDAARIIARVQANGGNVVLGDCGVRVINADNLPAGALNFIQQHKGEIAQFLHREAEDGAEIAVSVGWLPRDTAEGIARLLIANAPDDPDWTWFCTQAMNIMDGVITNEVVA